MGWWDDAKNYVKEHPAVLAGPVGIAADQAGLFAPRTEGQYAGVDRNNFNLPGGDEMRARDEALGAQFGQRQAPQAADSPYWQQQQMQAGEQFRRQMNDTTGENSLSQQLLRQNTNANAAQQRSFAAGASPGNSAMAQRLAGQNIGRLNQNSAAQAGMMNIQERNNAASQLAGLSGQARGQTMQGNQFNTGAQLQQTGLNDQAQGNAYGRQLTASGMQQQGGMGYEGNRTQRAAGALAQPTPGEEFLGMAMGAAQMGAMSDERNKTGVTNGSGDVRAFLDRVSPASYSYNQTGPGAPSGRHTGVMAQDLEQSTAGRGAVMDTPQGKMVDYGQLSGTMLASLADLHGRLKQVEQGGGNNIAGFGRLGRDGAGGGSAPPVRSEELKRERPRGSSVRPEELSRPRKDITDPARGGGTRTKQTSRR